MQFQLIIFIIIKFHLLIQVDFSHFQLVAYGPIGIIAAHTDICWSAKSANWCLFYLIVMIHYKLIDYLNDVTWQYVRIVFIHAISG